MVGAAMFHTVQYISFDSVEDALPAFMTLILIPLTLSITQGLLWGFVLHVLLYSLSGRARELSMPTLSLAALSAGLLVLEHVT
jgi:AGZA family xanthine/uracil permease-like MFS transporter